MYHLVTNFNVLFIITYGFLRFILQKKKKTMTEYLVLYYVYIFSV